MTDAEKNACAPWVAMYGLNYEYGLCQCGCGKPTSIATHSDSKSGTAKGYLCRFVYGHYMRARCTEVAWVARYGLRYPFGDCQCGCGGKAPIANHNDKRDGIVRGHRLGLFVDIKANITRRLSFRPGLRNSACEPPTVIASADAVARRASRLAMI